MKKIEVVAAIIKDGEKILATQRGYGEFVGSWEFPGGKMEVGESREYALRREILEELEVTIEVDDYLLTVEYIYPSFHLTMHCYFCHVVEGTINFVEHLAGCWLKKDELDSVKWLPADIDVVEKLRVVL
ncbi:MAG: (deoxy)nucleoside triphosphate pyrophosphohydrolase [Lachnospiraceae bacterium]|nr:(deoxy)nucleoside triphosphate pyrophosphohydrolase [Lachnospiraceae bacterium]